MSTPKRPAEATDFVRAAHGRRLTVDERWSEDDTVLTIQVRDDSGHRALDLRWYRSASTNRWRRGQWRGIRNAKAVPVPNAATAWDLLQTL